MLDFLLLESRIYPVFYVALLERVTEEIEADIENDLDYEHSDIKYKVESI